MNPTARLPEPLHIFVSYARRDKRWVEDGSLIPALENSLRKEQVSFWYDPKLVGGDVYRELIEEQIKKAQIAILLVSQDFLNSTFIATVELPLIQAKAGRRELVVIPILVKPCLWEESGLIEGRTMLPSRPPIPLIDYINDEAKWSHVQLEILMAVRKQIEAVRKSRLPPPPRPPPPGPEKQPPPSPAAPLPPAQGRTAIITDTSGMMTEVTALDLSEGDWFRFNWHRKGTIVFTPDFDVTVPATSFVSIIRDGDDLEFTYLVGDQEKTIRGQLDNSVSIRGETGGAVITLPPAKLRKLAFLEPATPNAIPGWSPSGCVATVYLTNGRTLMLTNPERYTMAKGVPIRPGPGGNMLMSPNIPSLTTDLSWMRGETPYSAAFKNFAKAGRIDFDPGTTAVTIVLLDGQRATATCTRELYGGFEAFVGNSEYGRVFIAATRIRSIGFELLPTASV